jgi:RNA polymerase sigma-70 factor, ECF subfamily
VRSLMNATSSPDPDDADRLLRNAALGDQAALRTLLELHHERLRRMVSHRLDSRVAARVYASDVVQAVLLDAARKPPDYERKRPLPLYPWLHRLTAERLAAVHREHWREVRNLGRETRALAWKDHSAWRLVDCQVAGDSSG